MIEIQPFEKLGTFTNDWLQARFHFSFADYNNPERMGLGKLRVWNDDTIKSGAGFEPHPHRDMEIITYVRTGAISHQDNAGNRGITEAGDVQVMSAGTGIVHSELNEHADETTVFQIWIHTDARGHEPKWETRKFPKTPIEGTLNVLASGRQGDDQAMTIYQDAAVLGGRMTAGTMLTHQIDENRGLYLVPTEGSIRVNGTDVAARDGVTVTDETSVHIEAKEDAEIVVVDTPL